MKRSLLGPALSTVFLLSCFTSLSAEEFKASMALPLEGNPVIVSAQGAPLQMRGRTALHPDERIETGRGDKVLIQISGDEECRIVIEPNSVIRLGGQVAALAYRVRLLSGAVIGRAASCRVILDLTTSEGRLLGHHSMFRLQAIDGTTTVYLESGNMRFFLKGESIPLRAMTRTTISRSGFHRISSMGRILGRGAAAASVSSAPSPGARPPGDSPKGRISPVSATVGQP